MFTGKVIFEYETIFHMMAAAFHYVILKQFDMFFLRFCVEINALFFYPPKFFFYFKIFVKILFVVNAIESYSFS